MLGVDADGCELPCENAGKRMCGESSSCWSDYLLAWYEERFKRKERIPALYT